MPGPVGKRDEERRRRNKPEVEVEKVNLDELISQEVEVPIADPEWEPMIIEFWDSLKKSGQAIWYEPSDWMMAYVALEVLDRWLKPQDVKVGQIGNARDEAGGGDITYVFEQKIVAMPGSVLSAFQKVMTSLMVTEGDRRRLRIELERKAAMEAMLAADGVVVPIAKTREEALARARRAVEEQTTG